MLLAAILLIFNNVRLAAFSRRRETGIMRLVGASDLYIQAPFILEITVAGAHRRDPRQRSACSSSRR